MRGKITKRLGKAKEATKGTFSKLTKKKKKKGMEFRMKATPAFRP